MGAQVTCSPASHLQSRQGPPKGLFLSGLSFDVTEFWQLTLSLLSSLGVEITSLFLSCDTALSPWLPYTLSTAL